MITTQSKMVLGSRYRRFECKACNHRISRGGDNADIEVVTSRHRYRARVRVRRFDDATIKSIRESPDGRRVLAKRHGCSEELIRAIRVGKLYRDLLPEGFRSPPGPADPSCETCREWLGFEADHPCRFGFPEPVSEGPGFARDCAVFQVVEG
jgi:hypothetical protein